MSVESQTGHVNNGMFLQGMSSGMTMNQTGTEARSLYSMKGMRGLWNRGSVKFLPPLGCRGRQEIRGIG